MKPRPSFALLFFVLYLCGVSLPTARAATPDASTASESDRLIGQALDLREAGKDREALPLLEHAAMLDPNPRARAQLALGQQAMGAWIEAERGLVSVLEAREDLWVRQNHATLEEALATVRRQLGWIEIEGSVPGAQVTLNGAPLGALPLPGPIRVAAGVSSLKIAAPGYAPALRLVQVAAGEHAREVIVLQPEPVDVRPPAAVAPGSAVSGEDGRVRPPFQDAAPKPSTTRPETLSWVMLAGSGIALAGGVVASVVREGDAATFNRDAAAYNDACNPRCPGVRPSRSTVDLFTGLSIAGYAAGAALGTTATVLLLRRRPEPRDSARASSRCGMGGLGVWCGWTF